MEIRAIFIKTSNQDLVDHLSSLGLSLLETSQQLCILAHKFKLSQGQVESVMHSLCAKKGNSFSTSNEKSLLSVCQQLCLGKYEHSIRTVIHRVRKKLNTTPKPKPSHDQHSHNLTPNYKEMTMATTQGETYRALLNYVNVEEYAFDEAVMKARVKAHTKALVYANTFIYADSFNRAYVLANETCTNIYIEAYAKVKIEVKSVTKANDDSYTETEKITKYKTHASAYAGALARAYDDYDYAESAYAKVAKAYVKALTEVYDDCGFPDAAKAYVKAIAGAR